MTVTFKVAVGLKGINIKRKSDVIAHGEKYYETASEFTVQNNIIKQNVLGWNSF